MAVLVGEKIQVGFPGFFQGSMDESDIFGFNSSHLHNWNRLAHLSKDTFPFEVLIQDLCSYC